MNKCCMCQSDQELLDNVQDIRNNKNLNTLFPANFTFDHDDFQSMRICTKCCCRFIVLHALAISDITAHLSDVSTRNAIVKNNDRIRQEVNQGKFDYDEYMMMKIKNKI